MKKKFKFSVLFGLFSIFGFSGHAQRSAIGIRLKEKREKSTLYELRIEGLVSENSALVLDAALQNKQGIMESKTELSTRICEVEVLDFILPEQIQSVVIQSGFQVSKSF